MHTAAMYKPPTMTLIPHSIGIPPPTGECRHVSLYMQFSSYDKFR